MEGEVYPVVVRKWFYPEGDCEWTLEIDEYGVITKRAPNMNAADGLDMLLRHYVAHIMAPPGVS